MADYCHSCGVKVKWRYRVLIVRWQKKDVRNKNKVVCVMYVCPESDSEFGGCVRSVEFLNYVCWLGEYEYS